MKLTWKNKESQGVARPLSRDEDKRGDAADASARGGDAGASASNSSASSDRPTHHTGGYTPPKGRPTPKRKDQERAKGVQRDPNKLSPAQQHQHRKELKASMSKEEWKDYKRQERAENRERSRNAQEKMAAGDERYLMARDKGEVRRYVRDYVDAHRYVLEWTMPAALVMLLILFLGNIAPRVSQIATIVAMAFIITVTVEGIILGRRANKAVRQKFPKTTDTGFSLGYYAFMRATQPRRWRTPRPQVERGADV